MSVPVPPDRIPLEPSNDLEGVMVQVAAGARDEAAFFARLWESELLVPQERVASDALEELPVEPGAEVGLPTLTAHGRRTVPVYSSETQMRKTAPREWSAFLRLGMPALQAMLAGTGTHLFVNPGGDLSTMLSPVQVAALPERHPAAEALPAAGAARAIGPRETAPALLEALRAFLAGRPEVRAAYGALLALPGEPDPRVAVGLVLDPGAPPAVTLSAAEAGLGGLPPFSLLVIDEGSPGSVGGAMLEAAQPLYER